MISTRIGEIVLMKKIEVGEMRVIRYFIQKKMFVVICCLFWVMFFVNKFWDNGRCKFVVIK
jgi:hypothetical protein